MNINIPIAAAPIAAATTTPSFEPQTQNRFIAHIHDKNNKEILPPYLIKSISRPSFTIVPSTKQKVYNNITLICYEPITPNISETLYNNTDTLLDCTITINTIDPHGTTIETYKIPSARLINVGRDSLDWSNDDIIITSLTFSVHSLVYTSHIQKSP